MDHAAFPPFYTLQQNYQLRTQYLGRWADMLLVRAARTRQTHVTAADPVFTNAAIGRTAEPELVAAIFRYMVDTQQATEAGPDAIRVSVLSVAKAAQLALQALKGEMMDNDVYTFAEMRELFRRTPQLSHFDDDQILQTLRELEKQRQLAVMGNGGYDDMGVKVDLVK